MFRAIYHIEALSADLISSSEKNSFRPIYLYIKCLKDEFDYDIISSINVVRRLNSLTVTQKRFSLTTTLRLFIFYSINFSWIVEYCISSVFLHFPLFWVLHLSYLSIVQGIINLSAYLLGFLSTIFYNNFPVTRYHTKSTFRKVVIFILKP